MDKINFKNLPNKTTSITAEKLNEIQENVEKAINEKSSLPVGGDEGQILAKASNQDNDVEWIDNIGQGGGDTLPIGAILPFSSDTIPNGWLLCDGSSFSTTSYPELFEIIGTTYGYDDERNPKLPDLRGKVTVGKDSTDTDFNELGKTGGEKEHTLTVSELPSHSHVINSFRQYETGSSTDSSKLGRTTTGADGGSSTIATGGTGGNEAHNNLQPYIVTNYIIKAKMTIVTVGEVIQENDTATTENVYSASAVDNKLAQIIQSGSNANGNYVKYSDGTMVCYGTVSITNPSFGDWYGFCRLANEFTFSFAEAFKDNNYSLTMTSKTFGYFTAMITSKTASSFKFRAFTHNNTAYNPGNGTFDYIAIGKWK